MEMLSPGPAPEHPALTLSSVPGDSCLGSDPWAGLYIRTVKLVRGILVVMSILRPLVGASSSSSSVSTPDQDSSDDYPEIRTSTCREPAEGGRLILMVAPNEDRSYNSSSRYPIIERSETSDARTLSGGLVQNLNPDFNAIRVQANMETFQRMTSDGSPLLSWLSKGLRRQTLSSQRSRPVFPRGNLQSVTMIGQGVPEVRLRHRPIQIVVFPSTMRNNASPRTASHESTTVIGMTFITSLKIRGISGSEHHPHHDGL
jgi:hypothetical protein